MAQERMIAGLPVLLPIDEEPKERFATAPRLDTFDGKVVGFLNNTKDNVEELFSDIQALLAAAYNPKGVARRAKPHFAHPAPPVLLDALHRECDAVIVAAGTCGSCTACSVQDAISIEKLGTPAVTICTEGFQVAGEAQARALGMPDHCIVVIAHPLTTMPRPEVQHQARRAWEQIVRNLLIS